MNNNRKVKFLEKNTEMRPVETRLPALLCLMLVESCLTAPHPDPPQVELFYAW